MQKKFIVSREFIFLCVGEKMKTLVINNHHSSLVINFMFSFLLEQNLKI